MKLPLTHSCHSAFVCSGFPARLTFLKLAILTAAWASDPAGAQTYWGASSGEWATAGSWSGGLPDPLQTAVIENGGTVTLSNGGTYFASSLVLGTHQGAGSLTVSNGWLSVGGVYLAGTSNAFPNVRAGALTISGANARVSSSGPVTLGTAGAGSLTVSNGGIFSATSPATALLLGATEAGAGTLTVASSGVVEAHAIGEGSGNGQLILNGGTLRALSHQTSFLRDFENGDVTIQNGGAFIDTNGYSIGISTVLGGTGGLIKTGAGTLTLSGANTYSGGTLIRRGVLALSGSAARIQDADATTTIGSAAGDSATLQLGAGAVTSFNGIIGDAAGSEGTVNVNGGSWQLNAGGSSLFVGVSGAGHLAIANGSVTAGGSVRLGFGGGTGDITLSSGGILTTSGIIEGSGAGTVTFNGGTLRAATNSTDLLAGFEAGDVILAAGGATFDTNNRGVTLSSPLSGAGPLNKAGAGTLTITGSSTLSSQTLTITEGTLGIGTGGYLNAPAAYVMAGFTPGKTATLAVTGGELRNLIGVIGESPGAAGIAAVSGGSWYNSTALYLGYYGNGTLNLSGGTVTASGEGVYLGNYSGSTGSIQLTGSGVLVTTGIRQGAAGGTILFNGGTLRPIVNSNDFLSGFKAGEVVLGSGGGTIDATNAIHLTAPLSGPGVLTKTGASLLGLSGANTHAGTRLQDGTLQLHNASALGAGAPTLEINGGILDLNNYSIAVSSLAGAGGSITNNAAGALTLTLAAGSGQSSSFAGAIQNGNGSLALLKTGAGSNRFTGNTDFAGGVVVRGGSLTVSGAQGVLTADTASGLVVGLRAGDQGTFQVDEAGRTVISSLVAGRDAGSAGSLVAGAGSIVGAFHLVIGESGVGSLTILDGGSVTDLSLDPANRGAAVLGLNAGSVGTATVEAGLWRAGHLTVGSRGTGELTIDGGLVLSDLGENPLGQNSVVLGEYAGGEGTAVLNGGGLTGTDLQIGRQGAGSVTLGNGGMLGAVNIALGAGAGGTGELIVNNGSVATIPNVPSGEGTEPLPPEEVELGSISVGQSGTGTLTIGAAGSVQTVSLVVGENAGSMGTVSINGGRIEVSSLVVGKSGVGSLTLRGGTSLLTSTVVGEMAGGVGTISVESGSWNSGASLKIGEAGKGTVTLGEGVAATSQVISVGSGAAGDGSLIIQGGNLTFTGSNPALSVGDKGTGSFLLDGGQVKASSVFVGQSAGSLGTLTVKKGTFTAEGYYFMIGNSGVGNLIIGPGGSVVSSATVTSVATATGSAGTIQIDGGTFDASASGQFAFGGLGQASLTLTGGGILKTSQFSSTQGSSLLSISSGGSLINTGAFQWLAGSLTLKPGGSLRTGTGSFYQDLELDGASYTSSGTTNFLGDRLAIGGGGSVSIAGGLVRGELSIGSGSFTSTAQTIFAGTRVEVLTGGLLSITDASSITPIFVDGGSLESSGDALSLSAGLSVRNGGSVKATGALNLVGSTGDFEVNGGSITSGSGYLTRGGSIVDGSWTGMADFTLAGDLVVGTGGQVEAAEASVGRAFLATLEIAGGTLRSTGTFSVGTASQASVSIDQGGLLATGETQLGLVGGTASVNVVDGTWSNSGNAHIGYVQGAGSVAIGARGRMEVAGITSLGNSAMSASGALTLSGDPTSRGILSTRQIVGGGASTGTLTLDGGILQARGHEANFLAGFGAGDVKIAAGGAFIDTQGYRVGISAPLSGTGSLHKIGEGTLTLSGPLSYTGATYVDSGTLVLNTTLAGPVTVGAGGALGGGGQLGQLNLESGGRLAPGNSIGTLYAESLIWDGGASMVAELGMSSSDLLALSGDLTRGLEGTYAFSFLDSGWEVGRTYTLITFGGATGFTSSDFSFTNPAGFDGIFAIDDHSVQFTLSAIPEPASTLLAGTGLCAVALLRRRSQRR